MQDAPKVSRRSDYSRTNRRDRHVVPIIRSFVRESLQNFSAQASGDVAMDIGCGEQPFRVDIERAGYRYLGMDLHQNAQGNVDFIGAIDLPLQTASQLAGTIALLLCTEVLEHVADWPSAFANMRALCAPGAICVITCPFLWELHEEPYDFWRPTPHAIKLLAQRSNFEVIELRKGGSAAEVLSTVLGSMIIVERAGAFAAIRRSIMALFRAALQRLVMSKAVKVFCNVESNLYLSNLIVLRAV
jgi:SAM-dependent methyltransferase